MKKSAIATIVSTVMLGTAFTAEAQAEDGRGSIVKAPADMIEQYCHKPKDVVFIPGDKPGQPKFLHCTTKNLVENSRSTACASIDHNIAWRDRLTASEISEIKNEDPMQVLGEYLKAKERTCPDFVM